MQGVLVDLFLRNGINWSNPVSGVVCCPEQGKPGRFAVLSFAHLNTTTVDPVDMTRAALARDAVLAEDGEIPLASEHQAYFRLLPTSELIEMEPERLDVNVNVNVKMNLPDEVGKIISPIGAVLVQAIKDDLAKR